MQFMQPSEQSLLGYLGGHAVTRSTTTNNLVSHPQNSQPTAQLTQQVYSTQAESTHPSNDNAMTAETGDDKGYQKPKPRRDTQRYYSVKQNRQGPRQPFREFKIKGRASDDILAKTRGSTNRVAEPTAPAGKRLEIAKITANARRALEANKVIARNSIVHNTRSAKGLPCYVKNNSCDCYQMAKNLATDGNAVEARVLESLDLKFMTMVNPIIGMLDNLNMF